MLHTVDEDKRVHAMLYFRTEPSELCHLPKLHLKECHTPLPRARLPLLRVFAYQGMARWQMLSPQLGCSNMAGNTVPSVGSVFPAGLGCIQPAGQKPGRPQRGRTMQLRMGMGSRPLRQSTGATHQPSG